MILLQTEKPFLFLHLLKNIIFFFYLFPFTLISVRAWLSNFDANNNCVWYTEIFVANLVFVTCKIAKIGAFIHKDREKDKA